MAYRPMKIDLHRWQDLHLYIADKPLYEASQPRSFSGLHASSRLVRCPLLTRFHLASPRV